MRRRKKRKRGKPSSLDKIFKYPVTCIKCGKGFLVAEEGLDLERLACDTCSGKLVYKNGKWKAYAHALKKKKKGSEVGKLLEQLEQAKDSKEKRKIRRLLRKQGHKGGLGSK